MLNARAFMHQDMETHGWSLLLAQGHFVNLGHWESTEALANTWSNCERAVSARFPEAVHGKKHLDNFQNKTKLLCRHLEFNNVNITHWFLQTWLLWYFLYDDNEPQNQTIKIEHKKTWTGVREKQTPATGVQLCKLWQQLATRNRTALPCQSHLLSSRLRIELTSLAKYVVHCETGATAMHDAVDTEAGE
jgi:hypothetical protein